MRALRSSAANAAQMASERHSVRMTARRKSGNIQVDLADAASRKKRGQGRHALGEARPRQRERKEPRGSTSRNSEHEKATPAEKDHSTEPVDVNSNFNSSQKIKEMFNQPTMGGSDARHLEIEMFEGNGLFPSNGPSGRASRQRSGAGSVPASGLSRLPA